MEETQYHRSQPLGFQEQDLDSQGARPGARIFPSSEPHTLIMMPRLELLSYVSDLLATSPWAEGGMCSEGEGPNGKSPFSLLMDSFGALPSLQGLIYTWGSTSY